MSTNPQITPRVQLLHLAVIAVLSASALASSAALAANKYWMGGSDWWDVGTSWNPIGQPQNGDYVYLTQSDAINRTITYRNSVYLNTVLQELIIDATGTGTMTLSQGTYNDSLYSNEEFVGYQGRGTHAQSNGSNFVGSLYITPDLLGYTSATGTYALSGNGILNSNYEYIGWGGNGTFIQTGGTNNVSNVLYVGRQVLGNGQYVFNGGVLTAVTESIQDNGTFTQSGGTHTVTGSLNFGGGKYNLSGNGDLVVANEYSRWLWKPHFYPKRRYTYCKWKSYFWIW